MIKSLICGAKYSNKVKLPCQMASLTVCSFPVFNLFYKAPKEAKKQTLFIKKQGLFHIIFYLNYQTF